MTKVAAGSIHQKIRDGGARSELPLLRFCAGVHAHKRGREKERERIGYYDAKIACVL